jgi:tryptophan synthase alpha chain
MSTTSVDRYARAFAQLRERNEGAFVPFTVLGDPSPSASLEIVRALARAGADMLELGLPFSDPIADGPTIQAADVRALDAGTKISDAWQIVRTVRQEHPDLPIGLLIYANLVESPGRQAFYRQAAEAGVDSVLVADVPALEAQPFCEAALEQSVSPVLIATPTASDEQLQQIAELTHAYTYVVTRAGVTGVEDHAQVNHRALLAKLSSFKAPPALLGFGISRPEHVRAAVAAGAAGAISGSAVVAIIERHVQQRTLTDLSPLLADLQTFVASMKAGTR